MPFKLNKHKLRTYNGLFALGLYQAVGVDVPGAPILL
jgi:hypothetical protein